MSDEPNYQKLVDPHPPPYDVFLGYRRWENNSPKSPQPHPSKTKPKQCVCPPKKPTQCPTEPRVNVYIHLLQEKIRHFTPEKFKSSTGRDTTINSRKTPFQISAELVKEGNTISKKTIDGRQSNIKIKEKEIQRALSCDSRKTILESKKKEKAKKLDSGIGKKITSTNIPREKKKNKSLDHIRDTASEISSKTSLAQRVSDVLQKVKRKKLSSDSDLSPKAEEKTDYKVLFNNQSKTWNNEQLPEKSLSFQYLPFPNRVKELCKSLSLETRSLRKSDKQASILEQYKNCLINKHDTLPKSQQVQSPLWHHSEPSEHVYSLRGLGQGTSSPVLSKCQLITKPNWRYHIQPQRTEIDKVKNQFGEVSSNEHFKSVKISPRNHEHSKKYDNVIWQQEPIMEKNVRICLCPHFHTDEGIKKVFLQSSPEEQEYGQKFFRVNYILKEEMDDSDDEKEYVDKGTTTEEEPVKKKPKTIKSEELREPTWLKTKDSETTKKDSQQICKPKTTIRRNKKQAQGLGESPGRRAKTVKQEQVKEKEEKHAKDAAANEVETLRKLFTKLSSAEHLVKNEKCPKSSKNIKFKKEKMESGKWKKEETSEADTESEGNGRSKKLKAKIIRHVQNWLDVEFKDD